MSSIDNTIFIDPITQKEFNEIAQENFNEVVEAIVEDADFKNEQEIAELFFGNGFFMGCIAMLENSKLREVVSLMSDEMDYQNRNKRKEL